MYEKFCVREIAAVNLSKINGLKTAEKTCKLNNRDLYHDRKEKRLPFQPSQTVYIRYFKQQGPDIAENRIFVPGSGSSTEFLEFL